MLLEIGVSSIVLESDLEIIINSLKDVKNSLAPYENLIFEVKSIAKSFSNISFSIMCREGNYIVHNFAKYAKHMTDFPMLIEVFLHTSMP